MLSIKDESASLLMNFLTTDLCNFSANSLFGIFSFLTADILFVARVANVHYRKFMQA